MSRPKNHWPDLKGIVWQKPSNRLAAVVTVKDGSSKQRVLPNAHHTFKISAYKHFFVNPFINFFVGPSHKILLKFVVVIRQTVEVWILQALQLPVPTYSLRFWSGLGEAQFVRFVFPRVFRPVAVIKYQIQLENDEVQSPLRAAEGQINSPKAPLCRSTLDPAVCHYKCVAYVNKCHLSFSL